MIFSRAWFALLRRNIIYRRRNWLGMLIELLSPMGFVGVLVGIKIAAENGGDGFLANLRRANIPDIAATPLSFGDYVTAMKAQRVCILKRGRTGENIGDFRITGIERGITGWMVPTVKCDSYECEFDGQNATDFCEYGALGLAPSGPDDLGGMHRADEFEEWLYQRHPELQTGQGLPFKFDFVQRFQGPREMDEYVQHKEYGFSGPKIVMGIVWEGNATNDYRYALRQNSTNYNSPEAASRPATLTTPDTGRLFNDYARNDFETCIPLEDTPRLGLYGFSCTGQYVYNGVITFQRLVGDFILSSTGAAAKGYWVDDAGVHLTPFPTPAYEDTGFYETIRETGPLLVTLGMLYPVASMISYITREKEMRQKELLKMMSVLESDIGWSWFATFFLFNTVSAVITTAMSTDLYENSEISYLLSFWFCTFLAVTVFSMVIASCSSKSSRAVLIGLLVFFIGVFLTIAIPVDYREDDGTLIGLISLHPVAAFSYGLQEIGRLEDQGTGLTSNTVGTTDSPSGYTFNDTIGYLITDSIFWGIVTFYLNRVIRPDYGRALPLWFPFMPSYWFPSCSKAPSNPNEEDNTEEDAEIPIEPVSDAIKRQEKEGDSIEVKGLCKAFGDNIAVDKLNLSMYSGQITALLGHNGAGKTTVINMLTGAMEPTEGYALLAGRDIRNQIHTIRQDIGICLQHDCLFPELTVREHVQLFSRLKGLYNKISRKEAEEHVDQAIQDVALLEKRNTLSKNLSGGMKRKLSVAIAFCGGSKLIFLDEPTSGMDPFARRFTWNVIRQYRQDRCIILTTHFMDEADILGDRIAIMAEGQLRCVGSSLFLKKTFGVGYNLTIEKRKAREAEESALTTLPEDENRGKVDHSAEDNLCPVLNKDSAHKGPNTSGLDLVKGSDEALISIVKSAVSSAVLLSNVGSELSFQLPVGAAGDFQPMFEGLDRQVDAGGIASYGVSITTLDEVFLLVARGEMTTEKKFGSSQHNPVSASTPGNRENSVRSQMDLEKDGMFFRHLRALFQKRAAFFRRDKKAWCCTTVLPSIFVCFGFIIFKLVTPDRNLEPVVLDLNDYNAGVQTLPKNPIIFNEQESIFPCQPASCAYQTPIVKEDSTNEFYSFCGYRSRVNASYSCTINESRNIIEEITDAGASAQGINVNSIFSSSNTLLERADLYEASQYGAVLFTHDSYSLVEGSNTTYLQSAREACLENKGNYTSATACEHYGGVSYIIQYNVTAIHVTPLFQSLADEALVRQATGEPDFNIQATIAPLPITQVEDGFGEAQDAFSAWFLVVLSFPFISGAFASFVVAERQTKAKHLQTVAGVEPSAYWLSTYLWDILNYQIPLWIVVMLMFVFDVQVLTTKERDVFSGVLAILILYGPASAGFTYCISYAFVSASFCNMFMIIFGFLIGFGGPIACFILTLLALEPGDEKPHLQKAADIVTWICRFTPPFCLGKGLFHAINIDVYAYLEGDIELSAWTEPVLLYEVYFLAGQCIVFICLAIVLDRLSTNPRALSVWQQFLSFLTFSWLQKCGRKNEVDISVALPEDDDVIQEQDRVLGGEANEDLIVLSELTKIYNTGKVAVNNLSLGIPPGECFGLLGINGAGKTTVMGMLTAEFPPTAGDATLASYSVSNEPRMTRRRIGYCPQFDAHFANLTGREHVELYASIKGIPTNFVKEASAAKLDEVGLSELDSDRLSAGYSGGMKRRLSLACATIGQPQIVFLDECSTGVDPVARREIWQLISDMVSGAGNVPREERTSVILTTHSMEECEALCPRIGIMATGRLRCLGSAQHLKNKFGQGYQIEMKARLVNKEDEDLRSNKQALFRRKMPSEDEEAVVTSDGEGVTFNLDEARTALQSLTDDDSLSSLVTDTHPSGYSIWKDATSVAGVSIETLAAFATSELRMLQIETFVKENYPSFVLRERQDNKARYEISSAGVRISSIFASIEASKEDLRLSDYGVSQTSLEQVFNMHAAEAERLKEGRNDG